MHFYDHAFDHVGAIDDLHAIADARGRT